MMLDFLHSFFDRQERVLGWRAIPVPKQTNNTHYKNWIDQGCHATMHYLHDSVENRVNPAAYQPWAKSIILFALRYPQPVSVGKNMDYKIASYALGADYHLLCRGILADLKVALERETRDAPNFFGFNDTSAVWERELAYQAGMGWRGKNSMLINKDWGTMFFIAGCFTDLILDYTSDVEDGCGACKKCLEACPTGALYEPGKVDARKCLSYLTIEDRRKAVERGVPLSKQGTWMFGCDLCQMVCPWNTTGDFLQDEEELKKFNLSGSEWESLLKKGGGFKSRFKNTALTRAGRKKLEENLGIVEQNRLG
ncbi:MAG: tRNA epoxyqueuosine(34) reductase QueG [Fibrobacteria bacterium]|nr:tRNA epoxyqueuosine(34) reductase QueG [Fibrobacteria bacterium]